MSDSTTKKASVMRIGLPAGLFFGIGMAAYNYFQHGDWLMATGSGLSSGSLFGLILAWLARRRTSLLTLQRPDFGEERILMEGPASHIAGQDVVQGYLFLTERKLLFLSNRADERNHRYVIPLSEIESVEATKIAWLIATGLGIRRRSGESVLFAVKNHRDWCDATGTAISSLDP